MTRSKVLLPFSLLALLGGCTSVQPSDISYDRTDQQNMARTERAARAASVQVVWINPPQQRQQTQTQ